MANNAWEVVENARRSGRFKAMDIVNSIITDFVELHGDRLYSDDKAVVGGVGMLGNMPITVIAQQKGKSTKENLDRNFAMMHPEGYRKAMRLMRQAEKFKRPIITFIDTPGAYCGLGAEERGQGESIARSLMEMATLKVPVIAIIVSEGGSGGALALAVADEVWMFENSIYSILSPEGFASILWKDSSLNQKAAEIMKLTASELKEMNIIENIIAEPNDKTEAEIFVALKENLIAKLKELDKKKKDVLIEKRQARFRKFGEFDNLDETL